MMEAKLVTQIVRCYRTAKKVQKAVRVVKKPTALGLLGIAGAIAGRGQSKDTAGARRQIRRREGRSLGEKDRHPASSQDEAKQVRLGDSEKSVGDA
jgi:hypothetical protein